MNSRMRNPRALCVLVHRWAGLTMAGFLLVAALTGSLLAYLEELDVLISPQLRLATAPTPQAQPLDPFVLREAVLAHAPGARAHCWEAGGYKLNFDLHRAGGLWLWAMLFILAWSSVAFNLSEAATRRERG